MIIDTDILIWAEKSHPKIARFFNPIQERFVSIITYMEFLRGASNKENMKYYRSFFGDLGINVLPITPDISHRAATYVESYVLSHNIGTNDALVAATAMENNLKLATSNAKHFKCIPNLQIKVFKP